MSVLHSSSKVSTASIAASARRLADAGLVAFPTETVYGLGADAANPQAVQQIFAAKGRPAKHPLIVHIKHQTALTDWAEHIPDSAYRLAEQFWPGPLTLVLKKHARVPLEVTGGQATVALRMPNHPIALALLQHFDGGIAAPSANRYCRISPTQALHVEEELGDKLALILDGGTCHVGLESTILDLSSAQPTLLRPGHISTEALAQFLHTDILQPTHSSPQAPGMMAVHYAPRTPTYLCSQANLPATIDKYLALGQQLGLLAYHSVPVRASVQLITMPTTAEHYARTLYASLRRADALQLTMILVEQPPSTANWQAINDRLNKAATQLES
jgi:L-threonylcarbamoyladenylate synthase